MEFKVPLKSNWLPGLKHSKHFAVTVRGVLWLSAEQRVLIFCWIDWGLQVLLETANNHLGALWICLSNSTNAFPIYLFIMVKKFLFMSMSVFFIIIPGQWT